MTKPHNRLPGGLIRLEQGGIVTETERVRFRNRLRRKQLYDRTDAELARDQADIFPDGKARCRGCGRHLQLSEFPPRRHTRGGINHYCHDCRAEHLAREAAELEQEARLARD